MTITAAQYEELKSVEQSVSRLEAQAQKMIPQLQNEFELGNEKEANRLESLINLAYAQADHKIKIQAVSMHIKPVDVVSLINDLDNAKKYVA
jgi:hypothetical protein